MSWITELEVTAGVTPHAVLTGNTTDFVVDGSDAEVRAVSVPMRLIELCTANGLRFVVVADPARGLQIMDLDPSAGGLDAVLPEGLSGMEPYDPTGQPVADSPPTAAALAVSIAAVAAADVLGGVIVLDAGRWVLDVRSLNDAEQGLFSVAASVARAARLRDAGEGQSVYSPVYWLTRTEAELPSWYLADPCVRTVNVPLPDRGQRSALGEVLVASDRADDLADATDGLSTREILAVGRLTQGGEELERAATLVRLGVTDDPWAGEDLLRRLGDGRDVLAEQVLGQPQAVDVAWGSITRSVAGLSGCHRPSAARRPRIVLFLVGPTGTGKTELAKAVARLIFGSDSALIRFDMSGYSAPHSDQRLIGAPPGYVGHESGGELTNALRARPFSVVLFDEIEKAHPLILDKFLQILDEGHLDDGLGRRVYFDQSVVVFTSNLGLTETIPGPDGTVLRRVVVDESMEFAEIDQRLRSAVEDHFTYELNRREIFNRLGENFVVFDFLRPDAASLVFDRLIRNVVEAVRERHNVELVITPEACELLRGWCCSDLSLGGRGIANRVESMLLTPLGSSMFPRLEALPDTIVVTVGNEAGTPRLEILFEDSPGGGQATVGALS